MAAPHVSGAAALYLATKPLALPAEVRAGLIAASEPGPVAGDPDTFAEGVVRVGPSAPVAGTVTAPAAPSVPALPVPLPGPPGLPKPPPLPVVPGLPQLPL